MIASTAEVMAKGMKCLTKEMGTVDAERFISIIIQEKFDYTKWQREYFYAKPPEEISREAANFEKAHPYKENGIRL